MYFRNISMMSISLVLRAIHIVMLWFGLCLVCLSSAIASDSLMIADAWIRETPPNAQVSAGYMTIINHGNSADRLIAVEADFASKSEIHEMFLQGDIMKMRPSEHGIEIKPGGQARLLPTGAAHLMFIGLKEKLVEGKNFDIVLVFEQAGKRKLSVPVLNSMMAMGHQHNNSENHAHSH